MALTIDWNTLIINVPKADTQLVQASPTEIRQLDLNAFRLELKDIEDSPEGMAYLATHSHNTAVDIGGVTLARVVSIINGYTVTFEDGQYAVNLVGANSNVGDVVNVNQVSIRSANSAGLTFSEQINQQSFSGTVWIDTDLGRSGTSFPRGTTTDPVNNWADASTIATAIKLATFHVKGLVVFAPAISLSRHSFASESPATGTMVFDGTLHANATFSDLALSGTLGVGHSALNRCGLFNLGGFDGAATDCVLIGTTTLAATSTGPVGISFFNCLSGTAGTATPILDCNNTTTPVQLRNWSGGLDVKNFTVPGNSMSIDVAQGRIILEPSCSAGTIVIRGMAQVVDNSGAGCTVVREGTVASLVAEADFGDGVAIDAVNGVAGTIFPRGTTQRPVNTWTDAVVISGLRSLDTFRIRNPLTIPTAVSLSGYILAGTNTLASQLTLDNNPASALLVRGMSVTGSQGAGYMTLDGCILNPLTSFEGACLECVMNGTLTLATTISTPAADISFLNCVSGFPGVSPFVLDCNGTDGNVQFRNWSGGITIQNWTGPGSMTIDASQGHVTLDASCTGGSILVRGIGALTDNSGVGCTVTILGLIEPDDVRLARDNARAANLQTQQA